MPSACFCVTIYDSMIPSWEWKNGGKGRAMNKSDLIASIEESGPGDFTGHAGAERAVNNLFRRIKDEVCQGGKVTVSGFGTFMVSKHKARKGVNPRDGCVMEIPARQTIRFKPSPLFVEEVDQLHYHKKEEI